MAAPGGANRWVLPALLVLFAFIATGLAADLAIALWSGEIHAFQKHGPSRRILRELDAAAYWSTVTLRGAQVLITAFIALFLARLRARLRAGKPTILDHLRRP